MSAQTPMFQELCIVDSRRRCLLLSISVTLHCALLVWLLHAPPPVFLAPSFVVRGERTGSATFVYFPAHWDQDTTDAAISRTRKSQERVAAAQRHITWTRSRDIGKSHEREIALANTTDSFSTASTGGHPAPPLGSAYGSLSAGSTSGFEIRPALWASGSDPLVPPNELDGLEGNVIVEITIDEQGNVVHTAVLQSLSAAVDARVVSALGNWHFHPATRDGIAVASKQDVYYHFPVRR